MTDPRREDPVLITDAQMSYEEELAVRKRRYKWTMGLRFPCIILAGIFYQIPWLAVTLLVISVPLPWIAVLIANDRLPRKTEAPNRYKHGHREIESRPHDVIDSAEDDAAGAAGATGPGRATDPAGATGPAGATDPSRTTDPAGATDPVRTADAAGTTDVAGTAGRRDPSGPG
ncbi:DUF3099 domain-containing protein [Pseudonocardia parietis]|uniref:DUF3099 family protein n=1 Tax=Pseudonocardia parietis TaxID=570936 RepID=A0ABS4VYU9_9PSEU|nr:hypothetical protein [Pseudonocardia parietis]